MTDSFFDMPAGMRDADMDMAALEEAGNRYARRVRRFGRKGYAAMQAGETIAVPCTSKATGDSYTASVRLDCDGVPEYSVDGVHWRYSAREAYAVTV